MERSQERTFKEGINRMQPDRRATKIARLTAARPHPFADVDPLRSRLFFLFVWSPLGVGFHTCTAPVDAPCCARLVTHGCGLGSEGTGPLGILIFWDSVLLEDFMARDEEGAIVAPLAQLPVANRRTQLVRLGIPRCLHCLACQAAAGAPEDKGRRIRGKRRQIIWRALDG